MDTQKAVYYSLLAAYVVFMVAMVARSQRRDRQISTMKRNLEHLMDHGVLKQ